MFQWGTRMTSDEARAMCTAQLLAYVQTISLDNPLDCARLSGVMMTTQAFANATSVSAPAPVPSTSRPTRITRSTRSNGRDSVASSSSAPVSSSTLPTSPPAPSVDFQVVMKSLEQNNVGDRTWRDLLLLAVNKSEATRKAAAREKETLQQRIQTLQESVEFWNNACDDMKLLLVRFGVLGADLDDDEADSVIAEVLSDRSEGSEEESEDESEEEGSAEDDEDGSAEDASADSWSEEEESDAELPLVCPAHTCHGSRDSHAGSSEDYSEVDYDDVTSSPEQPFVPPTPRLSREALRPTRLFAAALDHDTTWNRHSWLRRPLCSPEAEERFKREVREDKEADRLERRRVVEELEVEQASVKERMAALGKDVIIRRKRTATVEGALKRRKVA